MQRFIPFVFIFFICSFTVFAQETDTAKRFAAENELAGKVLAAHGGEKLRSMTSLVIRGSVDVTASNIPQPIPATFITIFAGEKYRFELENPFQPLKQVYDGKTTSSSAPGGFTLPPINRLGLPLLPSLGVTGFIVTALPEEKKKKTGFRMTSPEGYFTDFYIDPKTNRIKGYDAVYTVNGRTVTTSVEVDKLKDVEGVLIPERYVQRFDLAQLTVYANFKAKEILVNSALDDDVFAAFN